MKQLKITYISTALLPSRTANSVHIMKMCSAFSGNGHKVTLIVPNLPGNSDPQTAILKHYGVKNEFHIQRIYRPNNKLGNYLYSILSSVYVILSRPDPVYSRFLLGSFFTSLFGVSNIFENHNPPNTASRLQHSMFNTMLKFNSFKMLVVISTVLKDIYLKDYSQFRDMIHVAPDGADINIEEGVKDLESTERLQIGYIGHLYEGRGVELILEMAKTCDWVDFKIIGGTPYDIERIKEISKDVKNFFLLGYKSHSETEQLRSEMDILLAPYQEKVHIGGGNITTEKWMSPLKIFEYMASGKPFVCSDIPVLREILSHNENCLLCPADNLESWASAIKMLSENQALRKQLSENAFADLEKMYTWHVRSTNILKRLRQLSRCR